MTKIFNTKIWAVLLSGSLLMIGCKSDDNSDTPMEFNFSAENAILAAQADATIDGTINIMDNGIDEFAPTRSSRISLFPSCAVITVEPGTNGGTITLDFQSECQLNNGATVSGTIVLTYTAIVSGVRTIDYSFINFTYNGNGVQGGGQIERVLANADGNPQSTVNESIVVTFPNSTVTATRNGLRVSEWVAGVGTGTWLDNVYHINGNWNTSFTNGFERAGEVTETLVWKLNCFHFVSGAIVITQDGFTGTLDYGDGNCDNFATVTINGEVFPIVL